MVSFRLSLLILLTFVAFNNVKAEEEELGCTMICIGHVNLSLDSYCESTVSYRVILADPDNPALCIPNGISAYKVIVYDEAGNPIGNKVNASHIGKTLQVEVKHYYT